MHAPHVDDVLPIESLQCIAARAAAVACNKKRIEPCQQAASDDVFARVLALPPELMTLVAQWLSPRMLLELETRAEQIGQVRVGRTRGVWEKLGI